MQKILFLATMLFISTLMSCRKEPTASFNVGNSNVKVGTPVSFSNTSKDADSYLWNFGDGAQSTEENPSHTYSVEGNYTITLQAFSKNEKKKNSATSSILVSAVSSTNNFDFTYNPSTVYVGEAVSFSAETSSSSVSWNFGDGNTSTVKNPTHTFDNIGDYDVVLTAGNNTKTKSIAVTNVASSMGGTYNVSDLCSGSQINYTDVVTVSSSVNKRISVTKFATYIDANVYFIVNGNTISIPSQNVLCGNPAAMRTFSGSGTVISPTSFSINYTETIGGSSINCSQSYTK